MSQLPPRYWIWQTLHGGLFRFPPDEAERINTVLDAFTEAQTEKAFVRATDITGVEVCLHVAYCDAFHECTPESREMDLAINKELAEESKTDWSQQ